MSLGEKIKIQRNKRNLSQRSLAKMVRISQQQIGQYEKGNRKPKIETLAKISKALDCPIYDLIESENISTDDAKKMIIFGTGALISYPEIEALKNKMPDGYTLTATDGNDPIWITYPDYGIKETSISQMQELINKSQDYLAFELEKLRK